MIDNQRDEFVSRTACNRCGDCCEVIQLHWSQEQIRNDWGEGRFRSWVLDELVPISKAEAYTVLPGLRRQHQLISAQQPPRPLPLNFYRCLNFDAQARTCRIHAGDLPLACAGFPWYNGRPDALTLIPYERCSYHADVALTEANVTRPPTSPAPAPARRARHRTPGVPGPPPPDPRRARER
jgi:hypothetical protein